METEDQQGCEGHVLWWGAVVGRGWGSARSETLASSISGPHLSREAYTGPLAQDGPED